MDEPSVPVHHACTYLLEMIQEIEHLECYYDAKVLGQGSGIHQNGAVHFNSLSGARNAVSDIDSIETALIPNMALSTRWVLSNSANEGTDDYHNQVLREDGYL
jgi:hypothetical protein